MQAKLTFLSKAPAVVAPGASLTLILTAKNEGKAAEVLRFRNGGRVDMQLITSAGKVIFQWSKGMMFTMALAAERLEPGVSKEWTVIAQLPADLPTGQYTVRLWSMASGLENSSSVNSAIRVMR